MSRRIHDGQAGVVINSLIAHGLHEGGWTKNEVKFYLYKRIGVPIERE